MIRSRWAMAGLLLATLAAYLPALRAGFIWDDDHYVTGNRTLTAPDALRRIWTEPGATPQYYPLVFTTFWAEHRLWGLDPAGYHAVNVLLHAMNAVLVALLLKRLPMPGAWLAGLLFALHPVHVESVAWITERKNVLSGLFYLLALGAFWTWEEKGSRWRYGGALALFALALLAKSVTASLPCALFLLRWVRGRPLDRRFLASLLPFLLLGAAMGLNTAHLERAHVRAVGPEWELSLLQRLSIAGRALPFYLGKLAWPSGLVFVQYPREVPPPGISLPLLWPLGVLAGGAALWLARGRTGRALQAAAAFFAVTLFPALGFVNIYPMRYSFVADHYQYLASLGPIALAAAAACRLPRVVLAAPLLALGILTFRQSRVYETPQTLWEDVLSKNPRAWMAHDCLGQILANRKRDADIDGAIAHYQASLEAKPDDFFAHNALSILFMRLDRPDLALPHLKEAVLGNPDPGYTEPLERLERHWREGLKTFPSDPYLHFNLGLTCRKLGRAEEAVKSFRTALELKPDFEEARRALEPPR